MQFSRQIEVGKRAGKNGPLTPQTKQPDLTDPAVLKGVGWGTQVDQGRDVLRHKAEDTHIEFETSCGPGTVVERS